MKERTSKVHAIRIPLDVSNALKEQAEVTDRSFNRVVVRILEAHLKQENKSLELQKQ